MWRQELVAHGRAAFGIMVPPAYRDVRCGWVFSRRERYDNAEPHWPADQATYIREVWVEVTDPAAEWGWENEQP
jgi:hypothetical protein